MEYVRMGRTGLQVSPLCLGTVLYDSVVDERESVEILTKAMDAGINFFDTANWYNEGRSEEVLAKALKGRRYDAVVATKVGLGRTGPNLSRLSRKHIMDEIDGSLRRLGTDYADIYYTHIFDAVTPLEETMEALNELVRQGKVRYLGCSNYAGWQLCKALWISDVRGLARFDCVQPLYNLLDRAIESELLPLCVEEEVSVYPFGPLAGGLLAGRYFNVSDRIEKGSRIDTSPNYRRLYWNEDSFRYVEALHRAAKSAGHTMLQMTIAWTLRQPRVESAIVSARTWEQLEECILALDVELTEEEEKVAAQGL